MSSNSPIDTNARDDSEGVAPLVEELERRIEEVEAFDDATIGSFTRWDWLVCVVGAVVLPALAMWWFAG